MDLFHSIQIRSLHGLKRHLSNGASPDTFVGAGDLTPLILAATAGWCEGITALVNAGASLEAVDGRGDTALYRAVMALQPDAVTTLCGLGADTERVNAPSGATPLLLAVRTAVGSVGLRDRATVPVGVVHVGDQRTPERWRARAIAMVRALLVASADVHRTDKRGQSPLGYACRHGDLEVVKLLVIAGADVNRRNARDQSPMHLAEDSKSSDVVAYLRRAGARSRQRVSPLLRYAVDRNDTTLLAALRGHL